MVNAFDNELSGIVLAYADGGLTLDDVVDMVHDAMTDHGYRKLKTIPELQRESDLWPVND